MKTQLGNCNGQGEEGKVGRQAGWLTNSCTSIIKNMSLEAPGESYEGMVLRIMKGHKQYKEY